MSQSDTRTDMHFEEAALRYFELARGLRSDIPSGSAEAQALMRRARLLHERLIALAEAAHQHLEPLRDDLELQPQQLSNRRLPTYLTCTLTRRGQGASEDAQLYLLLREEGLELGFGFGVRSNQKQRNTKERFLSRFQRHHRKANRYIASLVQRDYRLWPAPNQTITTPSQPYDEWRNNAGAIVRHIPRGALITSQELTGIVAQVLSELLGLYGFLDRVYTDVPTIRPLHIELPDDLEDGPIESELHDAQTAAQELLLDFHSFAKRQQLHFPASLVRAFTLSLQTRPLTILSGVAGTGKSKLALSFARFLTEDSQSTEGNPHIAFLPVRPDWLDPQALLGYYDTLTGTYRATPFLRLLLRATQDPESPYFAILDEMNLARIEYYFADLLSLLESRQYDERGRMISQTTLSLHDAPETLHIHDPFVDVLALPAELALPGNLYIIGTINVDETTHRISPKVLDRANLIEVHSPSPSAFLDWLCNASTQAAPRSPSTIAHQRTAFARHGTHNAPYHSNQLTISAAEIETIATWLDWLFAILHQGGVFLGLRLVQEVLDFAENSRRLKGAGELTMSWVLDRQLLQKILPRIHGPRQRMQPLLSRLLMACWPGRDNPTYRHRILHQLPDAMSLEQHRRCALGLKDKGEGEHALKAPELPDSARKLAQMLTRLQTEPYVDFHTT